MCGGPDGTISEVGSPIPGWRRGAALGPRKFIAGPFRVIWWVATETPWAMGTVGSEYAMESLSLDKIRTLCYWWDGGNDCNVYDGGNVVI